MAIEKVNYDKNQQHDGRAGSSLNRGQRIAATAIIESRIENPQGDDLGEVENLMINLITGEIEYVVVQFGTFLGMGGKLFAIPFTEFRLNPDKKVFTINRDKEFLKQCPGFDKGHWPDTNKHSYFQNVSLYWGSYTAPYP